MSTRLACFRAAAVAIAAAAASTGLSIASASAEDIKLRIASGHAAATPYVNVLTTFFVPEVTKRVKERTKHTVEFIEGYGGAMVKVADTLEGVQGGIIDMGGYCFCFEPSNLPLHVFQVMLPFGPNDAATSGKVADAVYAKVPYMSQVLEDKFSQKLIAVIRDPGYSLNTTFEWNTMADLKGRKIAGAGLNLKWLEYAGVIPVQSTAVEGYTSMQTGVYQGFVIFPTVTVTLKWYEVAKYYTLIGFGAIAQHGLTINKARWAKLPKEVQDILLEVGKAYEAQTVKVSTENYQKHLDFIKANGGTVKSVADSVRLEWAKSLAKWPQEKATELDAKGLPATQVLRIGIEEAEKNGYKWPVRYEIKDTVAKK
jgi:TRAP-type C4-dicarboxylate transport system substrate-binding protein